MVCSLLLQQVCSASSAPNPGKTLHTVFFFGHICRPKASLQEPQHSGFKSLDAQTVQQICYCNYWCNIIMAIHLWEIFSALDFKALHELPHLFHRQGIRKGREKWIKVTYQESGRAGNGPKASWFPIESSINLGTTLSSWVNIQNQDTGAGKNQDLWILTLLCFCQLPAVFYPLPGFVCLAHG